MYKLSAQADMKVPEDVNRAEAVCTSNKLGEFPKAVFQKMYSTTPWFQNGAETLGDGPLLLISPVWVRPITGCVLKQFRGACFVGEHLALSHCSASLAANTSVISTVPQAYVEAKDHMYDLQCICICSGSSFQDATYGNSVCGEHRKVHD